MKIAAFSSLCVDHYPEQGLSRPGGNSLNFGVHARRLGAKRVSIAGFIGTDSHADTIERLLITEGIDISRLYRLNGATASNRIYNTPVGERYSNPGDWDNGVKNSGTFDEATWDYLLGHDVVTVPWWDPNLDECLKRRSKRNLVIVDFMHFDDLAVIREHMPFIDITVMSPQPGLLPRIKELAEKNGKLVIAMLGAEGSRAFVNGKEYSQPALPVPRVVDTTGCGDSYQAGFVVSYFAELDIQKAMRKGAETASRVLAHFGAVG
jgi:fructoselysine 6-kinase